MKNGHRLTDKLLKELPAPAAGSRITYDLDLPGFGARVTAGGARAFVLNYRTRSGRERRYTIGGFPEWRTTAARAFAGNLKREIRAGHDPLAELEKERSAPTIANLLDRFEADHIVKLRLATRTMYLGLMNGPKAHPSRGKPRVAAFEGLRKAWGSRQVAEVTFDDVEGLHARVSRRAPVIANRLAALLSRMFGLAVRWGWRTDNPVRGLERNQEMKRQQFLRPEELTRLTAALAACQDQQAANVIRLLCLTGARRGETLAMRWADIDLAESVWTKPGATTKQRTTHRVPLSAAARQLLAGLPRTSEWVFPSTSASGHRETLESAWPGICEAAGLQGVRIHDLRHTFASLLASAGLSLPVIGALLGHTQPGTTQRYAHLLDDPLRAATERVGAIVTGGGGADIVPIGGRS